MTNPPDDPVFEVAVQLTRAGYRRIEGNCLARIDRRDWANYVTPSPGILPADEYRRTLSKDRIWIVGRLLDLIPLSVNDATGFMTINPKAS